MRRLPFALLLAATASDLSGGGGGSADSAGKASQAAPLPGGRGAAPVPVWEAYDVQKVLGSRGVEAPFRVRQLDVETEVTLNGFSQLIGTASRHLYTGTPETMLLPDLPPVPTTP